MKLVHRSLLAHQREIQQRNNTKTAGSDKTQLQATRLAATPWNSTSTTACLPINSPTPPKSDTGLHQSYGQLVLESHTPKLSNHTQNKRSNNNETKAIKLSKDISN